MNKRKAVSTKNKKVNGNQGGGGVNEQINNNNDEHESFVLSM